MSCQALLAGCHVVLLERFDAEATLAAIAEHRADVVYLVPTMMKRIWRLPEETRLAYDLSSLRMVWHLAEPCPMWLKEAWIEWLGAERIWELYAGTEGQAVTVITGDEWLEHRGSVGRAVIGEFMIADLDGNPLPPGEKGEVWLRNTSGKPTYRYIGAEPRTLDGGWESLGDMGWCDEDGYLYLADRMQDMILSGGANIYPAEVEAALLEHPAVRSVAVIGLPDEDRGQHRPRHRRGRPGCRRRGRAARLRRRAPGPLQAAPHRWSTSTRHCAMTVGKCAGPPSAPSDSDGSVLRRSAETGRFRRTERGGRWPVRLRAMHDDRELVEERIRRELTERVLPLVHPARVPLEVEAGPSLDELAPFAVGAALGASVGHDVVPVHRRGAGVVVGPPRRGADRSRLPARHPGLPVRGPRPRRQGAPGAGDPPAPPGGAAARGARSGRARRRSGGQSPAAPVPAVAARLARDRRRPAALHARPGRARAGRHRRRSAPPRPRRARRGDAHARRSTTRAGPASARASCAPSTCSPSRPPVATTRPSPPGRLLDPALAVPARASAHRVDRHRARPHRHRLAVAAAGDGAQVHAHVRLGGRPDGRRPRLPVLVLAGAAVRLDRRARARAVRPHRRQGRRRAVGPGRRDVGRAGHEPAVRREHRAPDRPRSALLRSSTSGCAAARCGSPTCSGTRPACPRCSWPVGCVGSSPRSCRGTAPTGSRTPRSSGRASTAPGCSPTSRPSTRTTPRSRRPSWRGRRRTSPSTPGAAGRCCRSGTATVAAVRRGRCSSGRGGSPTSTGCPGSSWARPPGSSSRSRPRLRRGAPVPVWRGELYFENHRGTLTSQLRTKLGNKRCERLLRELELWTATQGTADPPRRSTRCGRRCSRCSSTTSCRARRSPGSTPTPRPPTPASAPSSSRASPACLRELAPPGPVLANIATHDRDEVVIADVAPDGDGPTQRAPRRAHRVPGAGARPRDWRRRRRVDGTERVVVTDRSMTNGRLAVAWDLHGNLRSVIDVGHARELLPEGRLGAVLELAPDHPVRYDAWDIEAWVRNAPEQLTGAESVEVVADGPLVGMVRVQRRFGPSSATITYVLRAGSRPPRRARRARLAALRAPAVDGVPARRPGRHRDVRHPVRFRRPSDPPVDVMGRGQVRGVRPPLRRRRRTRLRRRRAQRRALRPRPVRRRRPGQPRPGRPVPGPRPGQGSPRDHDQPVPARAGARRRGRRGRASRSPGARRRWWRRRRSWLRPSCASPASASRSTRSSSPTTGPAISSSGSTRRAATGRGSASGPTGGSPPASRCNLLEEPASGFEVSDGIVALTLRPFELVTLRHRMHALVRCR